MDKRLKASCLVFCGMFLFEFMLIPKPETPLIGAIYIVQCLLSSYFLAKAAWIFSYPSRKEEYPTRPPISC